MSNYFFLIYYTFKFETPDILAVIMCWDSNPFVLKVVAATVQVHCALLHRTFFFLLDFLYLDADEIKNTQGWQWCREAY